MLKGHWQAKRLFQKAVASWWKTTSEERQITDINIKQCQLAMFGIFKAHNSILQMRQILYYICTPCTWCCLSPFHLFFVLVRESDHCTQIHQHPQVVKARFLLLMSPSSLPVLWASSSLSATLLLCSSYEKSSQTLTFSLPLWLSSPFDVTVNLRMSTFEWCL